jgi:hypothetical protein
VGRFASWRPGGWRLPWGGRRLGRPAWVWRGSLAVAGVIVGGPVAVTAVALVLLLALGLLAALVAAAVTFTLLSGVAWVLGLPARLLGRSSTALADDGRRNVRVIRREPSR